jgi:hypothetical protein
MAMLLAVGLVLGLLFWAFNRSREVFCIHVERGRVRVVRGYAPTGLLNDFGPAVRGVQQGTIKAHKAQGGARISCSGQIDRDTEQRLRNIFGLYPTARLRAPTINKRQTVSDAFTLAWIVSMLRDFFR